MMRSPAIPCRDVVEIVTSYLEGTLRRRERKRVEKHLKGCGACSEYLAQMRETIRVTGTLREEDVPEQIRAELVEAFRGWRSSR